MAKIYPLWKLIRLPFRQIIKTLLLCLPIFALDARVGNGLVSRIPLTILENAELEYSFINSVDFHPQKNMFCVVYTNNNKIAFYEINKKRRCRRVQTFRNPLAKLSEPQHAIFSPSGDKVVVANWTSQTLSIYPLEKSGLFCTIPAVIIPSPPALARCKPHGMAFSPCGKYLAIAYGGATRGFERGVALFHSQGTHLDCISFLKNDELTGTPKGITFSPNGTHLLVTFCSPDSLAIFHVNNQKINPIPTQVIQGVNSGISRPEDIKLLPDGLSVAITNSNQNTVTFYPFDPKSNSLLQSTPSWTLRNPQAQLSFPHGIAFSSDGKYVAITQFGLIRMDEREEIIWDPKMESSEGKINLYLMNRQESKNSN